LRSAGLGGSRLAAVLVVRTSGHHLANLLVPDFRVELVAVLANLLNESLVVLGVEVNILVSLVNAIECTHWSPPLEVAGTLRIPQLGSLQSFSENSRATCEYSRAGLGAPADGDAQAGLVDVRLVASELYVVNVRRAKLNLRDVDPVDLSHLLAKPRIERRVR
jgi:hypothetical protein